MLNLLLAYQKANFAHKYTNIKFNLYYQVQLKSVNWENHETNLLGNPICLNSLECCSAQDIDLKINQNFISVQNLELLKMRLAYIIFTLWH